MKKYKYFVIPIMMLLGIIFMGAFASEVHASTKGTLVVDYKDGIYYTRRGGGQSYLSAQYAFYSMNGEVVYCVEPGVDVSTLSYTGEAGFVNSPYSAEVNSAIQLIGHYGYEYPGHQTTRYRMATQALIWEKTGGQIVEYWTEQYGYGDYINIDYEKNQIMSLVNAHYNKPSFNGTTKTAYLNQEIVFEDTNGILSQFDVLSNGGNTVRKEGNKLYITPNVIGETTISVVRAKYDNATTIVFVGSDGKSQKMGKFRASDPVVASIKINTLGAKISIEKVDSETNKSIPQGDATLQGAVYGIYDENDFLLAKVETGADGKITSDYLSKIGKMKIKELSASKGYKLDTTVYNLEVTLDNLNPIIRLQEEVIKKDITIFKVFASGETGILKAEPNITFDVYLKSSNSFYTSITTDKNGYATTTLPYGTYILKQKNSTPDYEKVDDVEIVVNEKSDDNIYKLISNAPIEARLKVVKTDSETGKTIPRAGIKFKIKDLSTNEYVCQTITYPTAQKVCVFETDKNGILITPYELVGDFQLEEVEDQIIDGYLWNSEPLKFHIGDGSEFEVSEDYGILLTVKFNNTRVKGTVEVNKLGEKLVLNDGTFGYEKVALKNVKYGVYANEDIFINGELKNKKDDLVTTITTNEKGIASASSLELGKYYLVELETDSGHIIDTNKYYFELNYKDQYTPIIIKTMDFENYLKKGKLEFTKTDLSTSEPLPNTKIEIYTADDEIIFKGTTDENGKVIIDNLFVGKFYIVESEAPEGYILNEEKMYFEIKENGEIIKCDMTNEKIKGTFEFTKTDLSTSEPLPNTKIEIYNDKDELVFTKTTDENGKVIIEDLEYGKYYIVESEAPEGYILNEEKMYFEIKENGEIIKCDMTNEKIKGTLEFTKIDSFDKKVIPNTKIEIYNDKDELLFTEVTDENGKVIIEDLEYGKYYIKEIASAEGYELNEEKMYFEITEDGTIVQVVMTNDLIVKVPNTESKQSLIIPIISISLMVIGLGGVIYASKKKRK